MTNEDLELAIDTMKDRLCILEEYVQNGKNEITESAINARLVSQRAIQLLERANEKEKELHELIFQMGRRQTDIAHILTKWATYFSMRPNINFRQNVEEHCKIEESFTEIAKNMEQSIK